MLARVMVMFTGAVEPRWMTAIVTFVPAVPRILLVSTSKLMPVVVVPSMAVMTSPALTPAASAGEPVSTLVTVNTPALSAIITPIPATVSPSEAWNAAYS